ncbi:MAG: DJ-1/PfpI family protein [Gammaproteobacteria bacterium]|nr:DJ-1/PfpI family protein [Gammaproteobacteria bacterium]
MYTVAIIVSTFGYHWEEVLTPYLVFEANGWQALFFTLDGKQPTADPNSVVIRPLLCHVGLGTKPEFAPSSEIGLKFLQALQNNMQAVDEISIKDIDALYVAGGHGALFDINVALSVHKKIKEAFEAGKIISAVCHGVSALAFVQESNQAIVKGKKITCFPDLEDDLLIPLGLVDKKFLPLPYRNEQKLREAGALMDVSQRLLSLLNPSYYVVDFPFVTGVGPKAAQDVAEAVATLGSTPQTL